MKRGRATVFLIPPPFLWGRDERSSLLGGWPKASRVGACSADSNVGRDCAETTPTPASAVARPTLPTLRGGGIRKSELARLDPTWGGMKTRNAIGFVSSSQ
jgi:hypothetical protein